MWECSCALVTDTTLKHRVTASLPDYGYAQTVELSLVLHEIAVPVHRAIYWMLCRQAVRIWRH